MCGIVGYIGRRDAIPVLLEGLRSLEYRGYDSAGLAVISRNRLQANPLMKRGRRHTTPWANIWGCLGD